jgi:hypothetical protein
MIRPLLVPALALLPLTQPTPLRRIDLTGNPAAVIDEPFTRIAGARELSGTRAVVTDDMDHSVVIADFSTHSATKIGRKGRGPAEYQFPTGPLAGPANTTWIVDASLARALVVSPEGKITSSVSFPDAGLGSAHASDRDGRIYFQTGDFNPQTGGFSDTVAIVRWSPSTRTVDTIGRTWSGGRVILNRKSGRASLARSITPFPQLDAWTVLPNGRLVLIRHDPFRIDIASASGTMIQGTPLTYSPIKISAAEREAYRSANAPARMAGAMIGGGTGRQMRGQQFEDGEFPQSMPPFIGSAVLTTPEGEIWIGRSHSAADKTWTYDIFDSAGRPAGTASLKTNRTVVGFGLKSVYVARVNPDDDLVYLEKFAR